MIYILSILFIVGIFLYYRKTIPEIESGKRYTLIILRSAAAVIILIYLLNPVLRYIQRTMLDPVVVVLEDRSLSMQQKLSGKTKADYFAQQAEAARNGYKKSGYELDEYGFASGLIERNDSLALQSTRLQPALEQLAKKQKLDNVNRLLLVSDGWLQDDNLDFVRKLGIPVDVIVPAIEEREFDLEITSVVANRNAFTDEDTPIAVEAAAREYDGEAQITLMIDKKAVAQKTVSFKDSPYQEEMFEYRFQQEGLHLIEISIEPIGTDLIESNAGNNRKPTGVSVTSKKKDIVVLTDSPGWDTRFLKDALQLDRNWNLDILHYQKGAFYRKQTKLNSNQLKDLHFHLVIVINHGNLRIPKPFEDHIKQSVQSGSGLWAMGYPILEEILPAKSSNIRKSFEGSILFTDEANQFETFANRDASSIPPIDYLYVNPTADARHLATVANEQRSPAILYHQFGQGKVLYFSFLNLWKWQMWAGDNPYRVFIGDVVSWLTALAKDRFQAYAEEQVVSMGETVNIRLFALDETMRHQTNLNPSVKITDSEQNTAYKDYLKADDEGYRCSFTPEKPGKYTFYIQDNKTAQKTEGRFQVTTYNAEAADRGINEPLLRFLAGETAGSVVSESFAPVKQSPIAFETFREIALYRKYWLLAIFLLCYGLELLLRKRWGLL